MDQDAVAELELLPWLQGHRPVVPLRLGVGGRVLGVDLSAEGTDVRLGEIPGMPAVRIVQVRRMIEYGDADLLALEVADEVDPGRTVSPHSLLVDAALGVDDLPFHVS